MQAEWRDPCVTSRYLASEISMPVIINEYAGVVIRPVLIKSVTFCV